MLNVLLEHVIAELLKKMLQNRSRGIKNPQMVATSKLNFLLVYVIIMVKVLKKM